MARTFTAAVDDWIAKSKERTDKVFKQALQDTLQEANRDTSHGGNMRVDTGFLRNSLKVQQGSMPSGPTRGDKNGSYPEPDIALAIARMHITDTVYAGWTAEYARPREDIDGFLEAAVQKWPEFVRRAARDLER